MWKVVPPDISNPFKDPLSDSQLHDWLNNPAALRRAAGVKVLCDGYEVLYIKNLVSPIFCSEHPCITETPFDETLDYMARSGVDSTIEEELERTRTEIRAELERRDSQPRIYEGGALLQAKDKKKGPKTPKYGSTVRLIRG